MDIKRSLFNELCDDLTDRRCSILVGARQVGKTYLLKKIEKEARSRGLTTAYFDLEIPSDTIKFNAPEVELFDLLTKSADIVLLDEFHYLENASHLFKAVYDSGENVKIFASGSSSLEIHRHLKESLAGRKRVHHIFPCSMDEMFTVNDTIENYLRFGGMPGLIHFDNEEHKKGALQEIVQSYVIKDIKSLIKEENIRAFNTLMYLLAQNQGGIISGPQLAGEVGLTPRTIDSYLDIMDQTYVNHVVHSYSTNLGNELKKSRKSYLFDIGIRNVLLKDFRPHGSREDGGTIIESFVYLELAKRITPEVEIRFWRTKSGDEVDFVWVQNRRPHPIEVKSADCGTSLPDGIKAFLRRYPKTAHGFVLHGGLSADIQVDSTAIHFRPWHKAASILDEMQ